MQRNTNPDRDAQALLNELLQWVDAYIEDDCPHCNRRLLDRTTAESLRTLRARAEALGNHNAGGIGCCTPEA